MIININTTKENFYNQYYSILNYIFKLSKKELAILSKFSFLRANLPKDLSAEELDKQTFNNNSRKKVAESLGISIQNLNNYIKVLKRKKFLITVKYNVNRTSINPKVYVDYNNLNDIFIKYQLTF